MIFRHPGKYDVVVDQIQGEKGFYACWCHSEKEGLQR